MQDPQIELVLLVLAAIAVVVAAFSKALKRLWDIFVRFFFGR